MAVHKQSGFYAFARVLALAGLALLCACASAPEQPGASPAPAVDTPRAAPATVTIALLGATGLAGGYILDDALAQGYEVRVLARSPEKLARYQGRIEIVEGDARDAAALESLLQGSDVVISALGPVKADGEAASTINSSVTGQLLRLMPKYAIQRYIVVSGAAVVMPGDDRDITGWLMRLAVILSLDELLEDRQAEFHLLAGSAARWTLVRCPLIEPDPFVRSPEVSLVTPGSFSVRAGELARFVVGQIDSGEYVHRGPFVSSP